MGGGIGGLKKMRMRRDRGKWRMKIGRGGGRLEELKQM